ncbi:hypothetical protein ACNOYE_18205 [Nannocystaceae bacterium ST9]
MPHRATASVDVLTVEVGAETIPLVRKFLPLSLCMLFACLTKPEPDAKVEGKSDESAPPASSGASEPALEPSPDAKAEVGMLGSKRSATCKSVMAEFATLRTGEPATALANFGLSYRAPESITAAWVQTTDKALARIDEGGQPIDHLAILAALDESAASGEPSVAERARIDAMQVLNRVSLLDMRRKFERVAKAGSPEGMPLDDLDALVGEWDDAWCLWDGALRPLAQAIDEEGGEAWEEQIVEAFMAGRAGLLGKYDQARVRSNREVAEKSTYAVLHRLILARAAAAKQANDARLARVALGLLGVLEDRISDRNGPGLARVQAMLKGPPADIDADAIERELAKAFVKRARKYCDEAVTSNLLGSGEGIKGAWEGMTYTKLILPGMRETLAGQGFDADAYMADWDSYLAAIEGSDMTGASAISERLVQWNCAYQEALGIAACTATGNEPA